MGGKLNMITRPIHTMAHVGFWVAALLGTAAAQAQVSAAPGVVDPGPRARTGTEGGPLAGLTTNQLAFFNDGKTTFAATEDLSDGLGPRFNLDSCGGCHSQPALGGTSPATNPQVGVATAFGASNTVPSFITLQGPVREARFKTTSTNTPDGGVHALFVISRRNDGSLSVPNNCTIVQDNFAQQVANNNVSLRIPTPTFGLGLIEAIPDSTLTNSLAATATVRNQLAIFGTFNRNGNDGRIARFGWKAQNPSALVFSGEAYNVEMGITNEAFPVERDETAGCSFKGTPNDGTNFDATSPTDAPSDVVKFADFMRFLAAPAPSTTIPGGAASIARGKSLFSSVGCTGCHTPSMQTGPSSIAALNNQPVNLYSDLALHHMGPLLADSITQGAAGGDQFRTAPLWGVGQRLFFLHDGRTSDIVATIIDHFSNGNSTYQSSEAQVAISHFTQLPASSQQDLVNFVRSL
jgi:CxxC motif-containing protein (DUF1111 family)